MSYFDQYDETGERRLEIVPPARRLVVVPQDRENEEAWVERQAQYVLSKEEAEDARRQHELDAALLYLEHLLAEGKQGNYPGKILAAARAGRVA